MFIEPRSSLLWWWSQVLVIATQMNNTRKFLFVASRSSLLACLIIPLNSSMSSMYCPSVARVRCYQLDILTFFFYFLFFIFWGKTRYFNLSWIPCTFVIPQYASKNIYRHVDMKNNLSQPKKKLTTYAIYSKTRKHELIKLLLRLTIITFIYGPIPPTKHQI